jgi:hypothetical protein
MEDWIMSDDYEYYHDRGEQDASNGTFDSPYLLEDTEYKKTCNLAYCLGYYHAKGQLDGLRGEYNGPNSVLSQIVGHFGDDGELFEDAYRAGFESTYEG